jgi:hypothetical protein
MDIKPHDTPSDITAEDGEVMMDGPNGNAISFTPEAALETSDRLFQGGLTAHGQKVAKGKADAPPPSLEDT